MSARPAAVSPLLAIVPRKRSPDRASKQFATLRRAPEAARRDDRAGRRSDDRADNRSDDRADNRFDNTTQRIADAITTAIVERRLMPGTKLAEQKIADIFQVSRTLVRQALNQLSRDRLITLEPARGARVAEPGIEEARQVFEVRRLLEAALIERAAGTLTAANIAALRAHLEQERTAVQRSTDGPGRTRLLADFHVVLAELLGNGVLASMLRDLVSRSSLIALMYPSSHAAGHAAGHSLDEHAAIVDALEARDAVAAVRLMRSHLDHVERDLRLDPRATDLASALRP